MKIAFYGNVCNNMFSMCDALRKYTTHNCQLYLPSDLDFHNLPENDIPELKDNYPDWIHSGKEYNLGSIVKPWKKNLLSELREHDVIVLSSLAISLAPLLKGKIVLFYATGSDLTIIPFFKIYKYFYCNGFISFIKALIVPIIQKRGIRSARFIISQPFFPFVNALKELGISHKKIHGAYFPIIINTDKFKYVENAFKNISSKNKVLLLKTRFRVFSPTRIVANNSPYMRITGQNKGTDTLILSFHKFVMKHPSSSAGLYFIDRKYNSVSELLNIKKLIAELNLEDRIFWLEPETSSGFTRNDLMSIYSISDIVADEFAAGWFGSICVEACACSKPILSYVDEDAMSKIYKYHPFLSSLSKYEISEYISKCYVDPNFKNERGILGRRWAVEYHSPASASKIYSNNFIKLLEK